MIFNMDLVSLFLHRMFREGLAFEVEVGDFQVFSCGIGWTWRIELQWY